MCLISCATSNTSAPTPETNSLTERTNKQVEAPYPAITLGELRALSASETCSAATSYTDLKITRMSDYAPFTNKLSALLDDSSHERASLLAQSAAVSDTVMPLKATSAFYPYTATLLEAYYTEDTYVSAGRPLKSVATGDAFAALAAGYDMVYVSSEPNDEQWDTLEASGLDIRCEPIAHEALVFFCRDDSLTAEEQISLSSNEIRYCFTSATPRYRGCALKHGNGSTRCFEEFLSGQSASLDTSDSVLMYSDMNSIIAGASLLDGSIGYAFHQFYEHNCSSPTLRFVAVDGVYPSWDAIRTGSYPLMFDICVLYNADGAYADEVEAFIAWTRSEEGQQLTYDVGLCPYSSTALQ